MQRGALSHRLDCKDGTSPLEWKVRITIADDIASGIDFLHNGYRQPVIHRDVKSSNVLIGGRFDAKLSDFGLSVLAGDLDQGPPSPGPSVGTRPYMPPEAFQGVITTKVDIYGFGMILYELSTGLPPYSSKKKQNLVFRSRLYFEDANQLAPFSLCCGRKRTSMTSKDNTWTSRRCWIRRVDFPRAVTIHTVWICWTSPNGRLSQSTLIVPL